MVTPPGPDRLDVPMLWLSGEDWTQVIGEEFRKDLRRFRSYKVHAVTDLLRAIRNKRHHYRELPQDLKSALGTIPDGYMEYVVSPIPFCEEAYCVGLSGTTSSAAPQSPCRLVSLCGWGGYITASAAHPLLACSSLFPVTFQVLSLPISAPAPAHPPAHRRQRGRQRASLSDLLYRLKRSGIFSFAASPGAFDSGDGGTLLDVLKGYLNFADCASATSINNGWPGKRDCAQVARLLVDEDSMVEEVVVVPLVCYKCI